MCVRRVPHRRQIRWAMPGAADIEPLAKRRDLACRRETARLAEMHPDKIDEPLSNEWHPLVRAVEEFAHGDWHRCLLPQHVEVAVVLRRKRILDEKGPIPLQFLRSEEHTSELQS